MHPLEKNNAFIGYIKRVKFEKNASCASLWTLWKWTSGSPLVLCKKSRNGIFLAEDRYNKLYYQENKQKEE